MLETERLILRKWTDEDADSLFEYAKDPDVGPIAGWQPHTSREESLSVIQNVLNSSECYAICEKENGKAIGAIELRLNGHTDMTECDDECELGYWLGKPFWGRGYMPEAAREIIRHGFEDLGMSTIWCGYYEGNQKSKRVQEKVGFTYHHTCNEVPVPLMNEVRIGHTNIMKREEWERIYRRQADLIIMQGGELTTYNEMMNDARAFATKRMVAEAEEMGADAVVNIRYTSSAVMQGAAEVIAYGTAVKFVSDK